MYDFDKELLDFHDKVVKLDGDSKKKLAKHRDLNVARLTKGLEFIGEQQDTDPPKILATKNQGSYAMNTMVQHAENDYDIDIAVIFDSEGLPSDPLQARKLIAEAMKKSGGTFKEDPEARTNAVTVWYQEGHHIDFAVYRQTTEGVTEHASTEWTARDPMEVNKWFETKSNELSPNDDPDQLKRLVRLLKMFAKSRSSWNLPGGMILSKLVVECYESNQRTDVAFMRTLTNLSHRLQLRTSVESPVSLNVYLTDKSEWGNQVKRLRDQLSEKLPLLNVLEDEDCGEEDARKAWGDFFASDHWPEAVKSPSEFVLGDSSHCLSPPWPIAMDPKINLELVCTLLDSTHNPLKQLESNDQPVKADHILKYEIVVDNAPKDYQIKWQVVNTGPHAWLEENGPRGKKFFNAHKPGNTELNTDQHINYETTRYKGKHWIECFVIYDGVLVARSGRFYVNINASFQSFLKPKNKKPFYRLKY